MSSTKPRWLVLLFAAAFAVMAVAAMMGLGTAQAQDGSEPKPSKDTKDDETSAKPGELIVT